MISVLVVDAQPLQRFGCRVLLEALDTEIVGEALVVAPHVGARAGPGHPQVQEPLAGARISTVDCRLS